MSIDPIPFATGSFRKTVAFTRDCFEHNSRGTILHHYLKLACVVTGVIVIAITVWRLVRPKRGEKVEWF
jgi:hypothetical protein